MRWLEGAALIRRYDLPDAQRFSVWFCTWCGTRVPHQVRTRADYLVPAGLLDGNPGARPENSIVWASRAPWYVGPADLPQHSAYP